jgi:hypothetical protein
VVEYGGSVFDGPDGYGLWVEVGPPGKYDVPGGIYAGEDGEADSYPEPGLTKGGWGEAPVAGYPDWL